MKDTLGQKKMVDLKKLNELFRRYKAIMLRPTISELDIEIQISEIETINKEIIKFLK